MLETEPPLERHLIQDGHPSPQLYQATEALTFNSMPRDHREPPSGSCPVSNGTAVLSKDPNQNDVCDSNGVTGATSKRVDSCGPPRIESNGTAGTTKSHGPAFDAAGAETGYRALTNDQGLLRKSSEKTSFKRNEQPFEKHKRKQSQVEAADRGHEGKEKVVKLSPEKTHTFPSGPDSISLRATSSARGTLQSRKARPSNLQQVDGVAYPEKLQKLEATKEQFLNPFKLSLDTSTIANGSFLPPGKSSEFFPQVSISTPTFRPNSLNRAVSTPPTSRNNQSPQKPEHSRPLHSKKPREAPGMLQFDAQPASLKPSPVSPALPSPMPSSIPLPPLSIATYLQLELSSQRPAQLYIHRSSANDFPYESSRVKIERLLNFLWLPPQLEATLWFGALACFDSWLYTFTILPLRLIRSFYVLAQCFWLNLVIELRYLSSFVYTGTGRMWRRRHTLRNSTAGIDIKPQAPSMTQESTGETKREKASQSRHHRRAKSVPSTLLPDDKADMLKGLLIICTCLILLRLDASRMYHWVRGQAAIKLYVIYNVLEVCDRLFSAIGQDVLECLFSRETLERKPDGHSKILRPLWLFSLALVYTVVHSTALFYQVITLNVAVNSYSNALITLLMSNQFVEIKSTVFKKFEKENLFQLTCADVVERFQLWLMLTIIASRNIVETGGLSPGLSISSSTTSASLTPNTSHPLTQAMPPGASSSILPRSFTLLPGLVSSLTAYAPAVGHVLGPFLVVLGSEMGVDWLKHAYIGKFNNTRPAIYGRFLDVLTKDYYTNAFGDQNLTKRLGLPVIPLSCLFIRAGVQTYYMFMAAWVPSTLPSSATSLASIHEQFVTQQTSTTAALSQRLDNFLQQMPAAITSSRAYGNFTTILIFALGFLVLLATKLVLGILLLSFARSRYRSMKEREKNPIYHVEGGRRVGGWGVVEVDSDKRRWIYDGDPAGLQSIREREEKDKAKREKVLGEGFDKVKRYEMVAKRIW